MTIRTCDKCRDTISANSRTIFSIKKMEGLPMEWKSVDLCPKCEKMFIEWLKDNKK